jgi:hypothetical protein
VKLHPAACGDSVNGYCILLVRTRSPSHVFRALHATIKRNSPKV